MPGAAPEQIANYPTQLYSVLFLDLEGTLEQFMVATKGVTEARKIDVDVHDLEFRYTE